MIIRVIWLMEPDPTFTITGLRRNESHHPVRSACRTVLYLQALWSTHR
ncbi:MAG: hypothetical protein GDA38_10920 [Hormoscilla sp. SP12CHS1]|nr:hypothetical protein [Hormoscilla sp. SP12CHS1]